MPNTAFGAQERAAKAIKKSPAGVPLDVAGLGSVGFDVTQGKGGAVTGITPELTLSPEGQAQAGLFADIAGTAGAGAAQLTPELTAAGGESLAAGRGLLADVAGFDPLGAAQTRFERLQSILQPQRDRAQASQEARLLAQGRLDSSGGAIQMGEREEAVARQDAQLLNQLFGESESAIRGARADAQNLIQTGAGVQGGLFGEMVQGAGARRAEFDPLFRLLGAGEAVKAGELNRLTASSNALAGFNASAGGAQAGGMGEAIGTLAGGALGGFFGGVPGATAGANIGGGAGSLFNF